MIWLYSQSTPGLPIQLTKTSPSLTFISRIKNFWYFSWVFLSKLSKIIWKSTGRPHSGQERSFPIFPSFIKASKYSFVQLLQYLWSHSRVMNLLAIKNSVQIPHFNTGSGLWFKAIDGFSSLFDISSGIKDLHLHFNWNEDFVLMFGKFSLRIIKHSTEQIIWEQGNTINAFLIKFLQTLHFICFLFRHAWNIEVLRRLEYSFNINFSLSESKIVFVIITLFNSFWIVISRYWSLFIGFLDIDYYFYIREKDFCVIKN